jgi:hypothetical protein
LTARLPIGLGLSERFGALRSAVFFKKTAVPAFLTERATAAKVFL